MKLFSGTSNPLFTDSLAKKLHIPLANQEIVTFSDGEIRIRIEESVENESVIFIQSFVGNINNQLIETFLFLDTLKEHKAKEIIGVFPYLVYARQNQEHRIGEGISFKTVSKILESVGLTQLITYDIHATSALSFFSIKTLNIPILPILLQAFIADIGEEKKPSLIVVAPDQDGAKRAKEAAEALELSHAFVEKERDLNAVDKLKQIHGSKVIGEVRDKIVVLADDMIATGATLLQAASYVKEAGATEVYACVTHGIFTKGFDLGEEIKKIYISDSLPINDRPATVAVVPTIDQLADLLVPLIQ